ncbi:hypothetical protein SAMN02745227_01266 [Anaerobranca californiensis DSM 14826]|jgi:hypothetical protein|uniref:Uncharacterized protein n=1 Tax=Anaerobranca californiensis DSM 14826 TaxID=1120989 RepID=A0A1M6NXL3_9FIRM|nr:hypothetical protein [Anaerobranca californiensis]SHK00378.1 hypothetical protein SAMN02745227_01266 [Anaerobranca californiensis DSM 14826]
MESFFNKIKLNYIFLEYTISQNTFLIRNKLKLKNYLSIYFFIQFIFLIFFTIILFLLKNNLSEFFFILVTLIFLITNNLSIILNPIKDILKKFNFEYYQLAFNKQDDFVKYIINTYFFINKFTSFPFIIPVYLIFFYKFQIRGLLILLIIEMLLFIFYKINKLTENNKKIFTSIFNYIFFSVVLFYFSFIITKIIIRMMNISRTIIASLGGITENYWIIIETELVKEIANINDIFLNVQEKFLYLFYEGNIYKLSFILSLIIIFNYVITNLRLFKTNSDEFLLPKFFSCLIKKAKENSNPCLFKDQELILNFKLKKLDSFLTLLFPKENFVIIGSFIAIASSINNIWIIVTLFNYIIITFINALLNTTKVIIKGIFDYRIDLKFIKIYKTLYYNIPKYIIKSKVLLSMYFILFPIIFLIIILIIIISFYFKWKTLYLILNIIFLKLIYYQLINFYLIGDFKVFLINYDLDENISYDNYDIENIFGYSIFKNYTFIPVYTLNFIFSFILIFFRFFEFV